MEKLDTGRGHEHQFYLENAVFSTVTETASEISYAIMVCETCGSVKKVKIIDETYKEN